MVTIAQLVEPHIVTVEVVGSNPISHPNFRRFKNGIELLLRVVQKL